MAIAMQNVILKKGREKSARRYHPWIFSGGIESIPAEVEAGETVAVRSASGELLGHGAISPDSQIRIRMWNFSDKPVDDDFFRSRIAAAIRKRERLLQNPDAGFRLIHAESDRLPGLIVDSYAGHLVCQFLTAGAEKQRDRIVEILSQLPFCKSIYERSDADVRSWEGLSPRSMPLFGSPPTEPISIEESGLMFLVDIVHGHKTGFYLDQRENRHLLREFAANKEVLNCFAYTGGFGIYALAGGCSSLTSIDASNDALQLLRKNQEINRLDERPSEIIEGDVFQELRKFRDRGRSFDLIVLDPPKFAESKSGLEGACRGYKDINLLAFRLLRPNGILFTFSCSGLLSSELFQKVVADAAIDAKRDGQIIRRMTQSEDHPVLLTFPEGAYLKGLVCRVS